MFSQIIKKVLERLYWIINFLREMLNMTPETHEENVANTNDSLMDFVNNVLIVDDKQDEIQGLKDVLQANDIAVDVLTPENFKERKLRKKELLFLDFRLNDNSDFKTIMSTVIRPLLQLHFNKGNAYGIVVWSKHEDEDDYGKVFYEKIKKDACVDKLYDAPFFIISLDKGLYLQEGHYENVMSNIEEKLKESASASFFIRWSKDISHTMNKSVADVYRLSEGFESHDSDVKNILHILAASYSSVPSKEMDQYARNNFLTMDAYKAFDDLFLSDLTCRQKDLYPNLFNNYSKKNLDYNQQLSLVSKINSKRFFEFSDVDQCVVVPGNVYEVSQLNSLIQIQNLPKNAKIIVMDLTPPCDVVNKKVSSKLVAGFIDHCPISKEKYAAYFDGHIKYKMVKKDGIDVIDPESLGYCHPTYGRLSNYSISPICINDESEYYMIILDFRYTMSELDDALKDSTKYRLIGRVKQPMFADVLQKYSSYSARLGVSMVSLD